MDLRTLITARHTGTSRRAFLKTPLAGLVLGIGLPQFGHAADEPARLAGSARRIPTVRRVFERWRDADSNRGHHDF